MPTSRQRQPCRSDYESDLRSPECEVLSKCELRPQSTNSLTQRCTLGELSCGAVAKKRSGRAPRDVALSVKELELGGYFDMRVEARPPALATWLSCMLGAGSLGNPVLKQLHYPATAN